MKNSSLYWQFQISMWNPRERLQIYVTAFSSMLLFMLLWQHSHGSCDAGSDFSQPGHVLINHVIQSSMETSFMGCVKKCDGHVLCNSINMYTDRGLCELNSATHLSQPEDFVPASHHASYMVYSLRPVTVCSSQFCNGSAPDRCFMNNDGATNRSCQKCVDPLGMQDGRIKDAQISASSYFSSRHAPRYGRLYYTSNAGSWAVRRNVAGQYLQIDLGEAMVISKVATQGRHEHVYQQWVTKYYLSYSMDGDYWISYKHRNQVKEFPGNFDRDTVITNSLPIPIKTRYIRIVALEWSRHIAMRAELYGCTIP